jgi:hypothetical protein
MVPSKKVAPSSSARSHEGQRSDPLGPGNGPNLIDVSIFGQLIVRGAVLLVAVMAHERSKAPNA